MSETKSLNIVFAGTPEFAATALKALLHSSHTVKAVYTQPDRPAGRGRKLTASPVKELAQQRQLPVYQPLTLRDAGEQHILAALKADVMVVAAYGLLLPNSILTTPRFGCINIHASLLPRWRGAAPIQRAILAGDAKTGVTIMQMEQGLDTGPMLHSVECPIDAEDTSETLHDRLSELGASALLTTLNQLASEKLNPILQENTLATYAHKISKEEACINWSQSAVELDRMIRAFNPWPVAFTQVGEKIVRVWQAKLLDETTVHSRPGQILKVSGAGIDVATAKGSVRIEKMQLPGGRVLSVADLLNAHQQEFAPNSILGMSS